MVSRGKQATPFEAEISANTGWDAHAPLALASHTLSLPLRMSEIGPRARAASFRSPLSGLRFDTNPVNRDSPSSHRFRSSGNRTVIVLLISPKTAIEKFFQNSSTGNAIFGLKTRESFGSKSR